MQGKITLRHVGILVENLEEARKTYETLGFKQFCPIENLKVLKMADENGALIELVQGNWPAHIAVNWYSDGQGNRVEVVEEVKEK